MWLGLLTSKNFNKLFHKEMCAAILTERLPYDFMYNCLVGNFASLDKYFLKLQHEQFITFLAISHGPDSP